MAVAVDVIVSSDAPAPAPIAGTVVSVFDPDDSYAQVGQAQTDADGLAAFLLPGTVEGKTYEVRFFKKGVVFVGVARISVLEPAASPNVFDVAGTVLSLPIASDPFLCRCTGRFVDFSNRPIKEATVRIFAPESGLQAPKVVAGSMVSAESVTLETDLHGEVTVDLHRGGEYNIVFSGEQDLVWNFKVPDRSSANLVDLIHPEPVAVTWDQDAAPGDAVSVPVEYAVVIPLTLLFSNYEERTTDLSTWLTVTSSNEAIMTAELRDNSVVVTGVSVGAASATVAAKPGLTPSRLPAPTVTSSLSVTVTPAP